MSKTKTTTKILDAAAFIVQEEGVLDFTLEAVAKQAGISKGGLLYHFPSKNHLVSAMVQDLMQHYTSNMEENAEKDLQQNSTGRWTRAFIKETFEQSTPDQHKDAALMAAAVINPDALKPIQQAYQQWQARIEDDGLDPIDSTILRLAVDGLWFSEIFNLAPLNQDLREQVLARLLQSTKEA